jgi:YD repeat-containing protein
MKSLLKTICFLSFLILLQNHMIVYCQYVPPIMPPSPTMASLGKFAEIPVSYYTGIPNITIPLYEINEGQLTLPLFLSYHASGIKVEQEASWVGLGWALNAGGAITRDIRGIDDLGSGYFATNIPSFNPQTTNTTIISGTDKQNNIDTNNMDAYKFIVSCTWNSTAVTGSNEPLHQYFQNLYSQSKDGEPDIFYINFPEGTAKFIIDSHPSASGSLFKIIGNNDLSIAFNNNDISGSSGFIVTTTSGTKYTFSEAELQECYFGVASTGKSPESNYRYSYTIDRNKISGWYLTKINAPSGDSIILKYTKSNDIVYTYSRGLSFIDVYYHYYPTTYQVTHKTDPPWDLTETRTKESILQEIVFSNGKINFFTSTRDDLWNSKKLDSIKVIGSVFNKTFKFNYETDERLYLRDFTENAGNESQKYSFEYYGDYDSDLKLPHKDSYMMDYWGYYNGKSQNESANTIMPYIPSSFYTSNPEVFGSNYSYECADRNCDTTYVMAGTLKSIKNPLGGETIFEFGSNAYNTILRDYPYMSHEGGGLRIKSIIEKDHTNKIINQRKFVYDGGQLMAGSLYYYSRHDYLGSSGTDVGEMTTCVRNSNGVLPLGYSVDGNPVGYSIVTVYDGINSSLLKSKYYYTNNVNDQSIGFNYLCTSYIKMDGGYYFTPNVPNLSDITNGLLNYEEHYENNGSVYNLKQRTDYKYESIKSIAACFVCYNQWSGIYYPLRIYKNLLSSKKDSSETIESENYSYYWGTTMMRSKKKTLSNSQEFCTKYYYPYDYSGSINNSNNLILKYIISVPFKIETTNNGKLISSQIFEYNSSGQPLSIYEYSNFQLINPPAHNKDLLIPSTYYEKKQSYTYGDNLKRLIQQKRENDIYTSYIWGYYNKYPVAKIIGSNYTAASNLLTLADKIILQGNPTDSQVKTIINKIRIHSSMVNAMVYTYTYKPLVGISSETDPNGNNTSYEYDNFGRLKSIKDIDGNIIQEYKYHYKY